MFCCGEARSRPTLPLQVAPGWPSKPTAADFSEDVAYYLPESLDIKKCSGAGYDEKLHWRICCLRAFRPTRRFSNLENLLAPYSYSNQRFLHRTGLLGATTDDVQF